MVRWQIDHGATAQQQIDSHHERGEEPPEHLFPPDVPAGFDAWLVAFWELCTDRQIGMAAGPIPAAAIERWSDGMAPSEALTFRRCIRAMDAEWLAEAQKHAPAAKNDDRIIKTQVPANDAKRVIGGMLKRGRK